VVCKGKLTKYVSSKLFSETHIWHIPSYYLGKFSTQVSNNLFILKFKIHHVNFFFFAFFLKYKEFTY